MGQSIRQSSLFGFPPIAYIGYQEIDARQLSLGQFGGKSVEDLDHDIEVANVPEQVRYTLDLALDVATRFRIRARGEYVQGGSRVTRPDTHIVDGPDICVWKNSFSFKASIVAKHLPTHFGDMVLKTWQLIVVMSCLIDCT